MPAVSTGLKARLTVGIDVPMEYAIRFNEYCVKRRISRAEAFRLGVAILMEEVPTDGTVETEKTE